MIAIGIIIINNYSLHLINYNSLLLLINNNSLHLIIIKFTFDNNNLTIIKFTFNKNNI
jgi:hypothetical protein